MKAISLDLIQNMVQRMDDHGPGEFRAVVDALGWPTAFALLVAYLPKQDGIVSVDALQECVPAGYLSKVAKGYARFYCDEFYALDNFSSFAVSYRNRKWPTLEHAWQADKLYQSGDSGLQMVDEPNKENIIRIFNASSAHEAKEIAHEPAVKESARKQTDEEKKQKMGVLIWHKFHQHKYVRTTLERTKGMIIVEDSAKDGFWGRGREWDGVNMLGELWMEKRMKEFGF